MSGSKNNVAVGSEGARTCRIPINDDDILASVSCPAEPVRARAARSAGYMPPSRNLRHVVSGRQSARIPFSQDVRRLQEALQNIGRGEGLGTYGIDGKKGPLTRAAIEEFRLDYNRYHKAEVLTKSEDVEAKILEFAGRGQKLPSFPPEVASTGTNSGRVKIGTEEWSWTVTVPPKPVRPA